MRKLSLLLVLLGAIGMAGCGGQPTTDTDSGTSSSGTGDTASTNPVETTGLGGGENLPPPVDPMEELLRQRTIYFDFDKSDIRREFNRVLEAHARNLSSNPNLTVRLEGHADERGSREYNIGLGERRAQAVRRILLVQGASASQISTVSFGEERPAATGSDEESWALNRRVQLVYGR